MGLLHDLMNRPMEAYADAPRGASLDRGRGARLRHAVVHLVVAVLLGAITVTAIMSLRTPQPAALESRKILQQKIAERTAQADELQSSTDALSAQVTRLQAELLAVDNPRLLADLERVEVLSGAIPVQGPGIVVELDDAPVPAGQDQDPSSRVQDVDLQIVTNALWAAGAEAIAINNQRLTALTTVRGAGPAIQVDLTPIVPPYRVEAIGDVRAMQTSFARSTAANHLTLLTGTYGIPSSLHAETTLTLPGAGNATLRYARAPGSDVASSVPPTQEGSP